jgi:hypothetical protein
VPLGPHLGLALTTSYARQRAYGNNTRGYSAPYVFVEAGLSAGQHTVTLGHERLGADARAAGGHGLQCQWPHCTS